MHNLTLQQTREPRSITTEVITRIFFGGKVMAGEKNFLISTYSQSIDAIAFINMLSQFDGRTVSIEIKEVDAEGRI